MYQNTDRTTNKAWRQYEAGKAYKRRIGLYESICQNERFYRGDQWQSAEGAPLSHPVFNIIKRVTDYLISSVCSADIRIRYSDEDIHYIGESEKRARLTDTLAVLEANAAYRWERCGMDAKVRRLVTDATITGDGVLYCYWDPMQRTPQLFEGDIVTDVIDSVNLFVSDVNNADIQSQEYIILAGRAPVAALRREALLAGADAQAVAKICPDGDTEVQSGVMARYELDDSDSEKATYIIKFFRNEDGFVEFEKSTRECVIRRARTECRLYPVAYFNWTPTKNSFHGTSPITALIPNQRFVNRAYAMAMKHMTDTAFSKVIYDRSRIPEWTNEVGEAIAAVGGGSISDAVSVVGTGQMQSGYMELIESAVELTKELMGATESALGNMEASNTSAILALQETSRIPLDQVRCAYYRCIEELALIWSDMVCAYYPSQRLIPCSFEHGVEVRSCELDMLKSGILGARVDVTESSRYTAAGAQNLLDRLLDGGYISAAEYVSRLPSGVLGARDELLKRLRSGAESTADEKINNDKEENGNGGE